MSFSDAFDAAPNSNRKPPDVNRNGDALEPNAIGGGAPDFDPAMLEAGGLSATAAPDPFDVASLRLSGDFGEAAGVKKAILSIPVRKPDKAWFVRAHPSEAYHISTAVIELKEDRETYLVARDLWGELAGEATFSPRALFTAMNRQGVLFVWPVRLPGSDGKIDEWSRTAMEAADMARKQWCRVTANMALGAYEVYYASGELGEPAWPDMPFNDVLRIAFKDRYIGRLDHPVLRKLRGEM